MACPVLRSGSLFRSLRVCENTKTQMSESDPIATLAETDSAQAGSFVEFRPDQTEQSLVACFEDRVRRCHELPALKTRQASLTYGELNRNANRIAHSLLAARGEREEPVALFFEDSADTIAAILGALKAGKIYLPLDPHVPLARAAYILKDAGARAVVTSRALSAQARELAGPDAAVVVASEVAHAADGNPDLSLSPDRLASLYYTSGSTGAPNGVPSSHRARLINYRSYANAVRLTPLDRLILLYSCTFSGSVNNLFGALLTGAELFPFDVAKSGISGLADWVETQRISVYHSVPSIFRELAEHLNGRRLPHLRAVILASDTACERDVAAFRKLTAPACRLANAWGVSESPFFRPYWVDTSRELPAGPLPAVGVAPGKEEEVLLLDETGDVVREGETGEIVLRGSDLTPGYWGKPELTRKRFFADPLDATRRRYHTGDLGRRLSDGGIVHLGRKDFQVKIRGYRVELEEIEAVLRNLSGVKTGVVVAKDHAQGEKQLVAHLVSAPGRQVDVKLVRQQLREQLPDYMTPEVFVLHESLPLTSGGKIDRKALSSGHAHHEASRERREPRDSTEGRLAEIWKNVLRLPAVGIDDNFFELGGNSLQALQIALRAEKAFGRRLLPSVLIEKPTIEELAAFLAGKDQAADSPLVPLQPDGTDVPLFLVHGSGGHVFFYRDLATALGPEQPVYGLQALGLDGSRPPSTDLREIAGRYVREVRRTQPNGPYRLAGYCFGAYVALEMAAILQLQGEQVDFLGSLNADGEWKCVSSPRDKIRFHWNRFARLTWGGRCMYIAERFSYRWGAVRNRAVAGVAGLDPSRLARFRVETACDRASRDYEPSPFAGRVTFFQAEENAYNDPNVFWGPIAGQGVEILRVSGGNETMFRHPQVGVLAQAVRACLDRAKLSGVSPLAENVTSV